MFRQSKLTFTAPYPHNPHGFGIAPIHDAKRGVDDFSQEGLTKFRDNASHIGMIGKAFNSFDDLANQTSADNGYSLFGVPDLDSPEVSQRGLGKADREGHLLLEVEFDLDSV